MIDLKKIGLIAAVLVLLTLVTVTADDWWSARKSAMNTRLATLQRGNAIRDLQIKGRDRALVVLQQRDAAHRAAIAKDSAQLASTKAELAAAKQSIDVDAATHAGLVPIAAVHQLEGTYEATLASCEHLSGDKDTRIDGLLAQLANQAATRADLDSIRVADATILKDTVAILKPPWPKRLLGWIDDHALTLAIGIGIGAAGGVAIAKK